MPMVDDQMWWPSQTANVPHSDPLVIHVGRRDLTACAGEIPTPSTSVGRSCGCAVWYVGDFPPPCPLHPSVGLTPPELAPIAVTPVPPPREIHMAPEIEARMVDAIARRVAELLKAG